MITHLVRCINIGIFSTDFFSPIQLLQTNLYIFHIYQNIWKSKASTSSSAKWLFIFLEFIFMTFFFIFNYFSSFSYKYLFIVITSYTYSLVLIFECFTSILFIFPLPRCVTHKNERIFFCFSHFSIRRTTNI